MHSECKLRSIYIQCCQVCQNLTIDLSKWYQCTNSDVRVAQVQRPLNGQGDIMMEDSASAEWCMIMKVHIHLLSHHDMPKNLLNTLIKVVKKTVWPKQLKWLVNFFINSPASNFIRTGLSIQVVSCVRATRSMSTGTSQSCKCIKNWKKKVKSIFKFDHLEVLLFWNIISYCSADLTGPESQHTQTLTGKSLCGSLVVFILDT